MKAKPLSILICAILSASNVFANIETTTPSQNTIQQEQNVAVQYALHNGKFYIKVAGLAFENVQDFLLNGEPITSKILELVTNKLAEVLKEQNAFTIALNLPKSTNFGGMIFGISSGNKIYSSEMPASVFAQDSIQTFDSVVSISDFDQIGNNRRSIVAGTILPGITNNAIYTTTSGAVQDLFIQSQPNDTRNTIINSGNAGLVGVGTNTPKTKLDVSGAVRVANHSLSTSDFVEGLIFNYTTGSTMGSDIISLANGPTSIQFNLLRLNGREILMNQMTQGNVGIKTGIGPKSALSVAGNVAIGASYATSIAAPTNGLLVEGNVGLGITQPKANSKLDIKTGWGNWLTLSRDAGKGYWGIHNPQSQDRLEFYYYDDELKPKFGLLSIRNNGNVGIGTTNPTEKLDVNGRVVVRGSDLVLGTEDGRSIGNKKGQIALVHGSVNVGTKYDDTLVVNYDGTFEGGVEVHSNMRLWGGVEAKWFLNTSDARLKHDVTPVKNALEKVTQLQGVTFRYNNEADVNKPKTLGFIAQEVEKVVPEVVSQDEKGMRGVAYSNLVALLVESTKEQQTQIEQLKVQNEALKFVICETNPTKPICQTK
jgi:hypothetical protein